MRKTSLMVCFCILLHLVSVVYADSSLSSSSSSSTVASSESTSSSVSSSSSSSTTTLPYQITEGGVETGILRTGDASSTYTVGSLKGREPYWNWSEVSGAPGFMVYFNITGIGITDGFNLTQYIWYEGSVGHDVYLQIYNWNFSAWEIKQEITNGVGFEWFNVSVCDECGNHTYDGVLQGRYNHVTSGNVNHWMAIDMFLLALDDELVVSSSSSSSSTSSSSLIASTSSSEISSSSSSSSLVSSSTTTLFPICNRFPFMAWEPDACFKMNETECDKYYQITINFGFYLFDPWFYNQTVYNCAWNGSNCTVDTSMQCDFGQYNVTLGPTTTTLCNMRITSKQPGILICTDGLCSQTLCMAGDQDYFVTWNYEGLPGFTRVSGWESIYIGATIFLTLIGMLTVFGIFIIAILWLVVGFWGRGW